MIYTKEEEKEDLLKNQELQKEYECDREKLIAEISDQSKHKECEIIFKTRSSYFHNF